MDKTPQIIPVEVIVSRTRYSDLRECHVQFGLVVRETHNIQGTDQAIQNLVMAAQGFCLVGMSVVVRPKVNELRGIDGAIIGYREWRSFDGEPMKEIRFIQGKEG